MKISDNLDLNATDYANQGNSIIGIRNSGKTYGATKVAEGLLDAGIPIIAFDPTGVWQNLRNGIAGNKGYPVVVAGGMHADIPLTKDNAVQITEAALKAGVSIIFDLKGMSTSSKSSWMHIVAQCIEFLMGHNDQYGLRHIFIEEAAEFVPQRPNPGGQLVYSRIESLARMGRNFGLGYTLINQRAEEIAKAVFEICEQVFVFRQSGKNSITSISNWLSVRGIENGRNICDTLPRLENGECWVINEKEEVRINILPKKTFHPDPKTRQLTTPQGTKFADTKPFIAAIQKELDKNETHPDKGAHATKANQQFHKQLSELQARNKELEAIQRENQSLIMELRNGIEQILDNITALLSGIKTVPIIRHTESIPIINRKENIPSAKAAHSSPISKLEKCPLAILQFLATYPDRFFTYAQAGIATGYSPGSGGFNNALSKLSTLGLIERTGGRIKVMAIKNIKDWTGEIAVKAYSLETFKSKLGKCEREIYDVLLENPQSQFTTQSLAERTYSQYSSGSGGFNNALSRLKTLEIIRRESGIIYLNPDLVEFTNQ